MFAPASVLDSSAPRVTLGVLTERYPQGLVASWPALTTTIAQVEDGGEKWMEVSFDYPGILAGDSMDGWGNANGSGLFFLLWSENMVQWSTEKFIPSPASPVVDLGGGIYRYTSRAIHPFASEIRIGQLLCFSDASNGDSRNNPFSSVTIAGVSRALPNFPYTMPDDAAQLQADLIADGWTGATVTATSATVWSVSIPDVDFTAYEQDSHIGWTDYISGVNPIFGVDIHNNGRYFTAESVNGNGVRIVPTAFAKLATQPGSRYGNPAPQLPVNPPFIQSPPPVLPGPGGGGGPTSVPYPSTYGGITGSHAPGATVTRTAYTWTGADSVVGTWWKNGADTESHDATYSDTEDGDILQWREVATNSHGDSTYSYWPEFAVSAAAAAYQAEADTAVQDLIDGLAGGAANMDVFSTLDHTAGTYTRNTNLWIASLASQLAAAAAWKSNDNVQSYGGILITPRHILYCNHAHPHAEGTWIYPSPSLTVRFVKGDNTVVNAIQICQTDYNPTKPGYIAGTSIDLVVAVLDRDVEALGIPVMPIPQIRSEAEYNAMREGNPPVFNVSQSARPWTTPATPISDYPQFNGSMVAIGPGTRSAPYDAFDYTVWSGDSGTPVFLLHRGQIYLEGIMLSTGWGRISPALHLDTINAMIAAADAGAVTLGRLVAPTGLTVSAVELPSD